MSQIKFAKGFPAVVANNRMTLMALLMRAGRPVASSCGGHGICGKCRVQVVSGSENLSPLKESEKACLLKIKAALDRERLSCQVKVEGDVELDTPYW